MEDQIIDDGFEDIKRRPVFKLSNWIAIILLWVGVGFCGTHGLLRDQNVILGIFLLIFSTTIIYFNRSLGLKVALIPLVLGTLNIASFFPYKLYLGPGIQTIGLQFELFLFFVLVIHIYYNDKALTRFLQGVFNRHQTEDIKKSSERIKIDRFKQKFSEKSTTQLERIASNSKMVPEAIQAATELLSEINS